MQVTVVPNIRAKEGKNIPSFIVSDGDRCRQIERRIGGEKPRRLVNLEEKEQQQSKHLRQELVVHGGDDATSSVAG